MYKNKVEYICRDYTQMENEMNKQHTIKSLINKTISGDRDAFEQLILSQMGAISMQIRNMNNERCQEDIEDIRQEVIFKVYQNISSLKYPEAFTSWLKTIIVRECFKHSKIGSQPISFEDISDDMYFKETDDACLPSDHTERAEQSKEIIEALKKLPEAPRSMMQMYYYEEKSYKKIADDMDITIGNVSANLFRAKKRLRKELHPS